LPGTSASQIDMQLAVCPLDQIALDGQRADAACADARINDAVVGQGF
jgi:hypothetical protein